MGSFQEMVTIFLLKFLSGHNQKEGLDSLARNFGRKLYKKSLDEESVQELTEFIREMTLFTIKDVHTIEDIYTVGYFKALSEVAAGYSVDLKDELRQTPKSASLQENNIPSLQESAFGDKEALDRLARNFGRKLFKKSLDEQNSKELAELRRELAFFETEDAYTVGYIKALSEVAYAYSTELDEELRQEAEVKYFRENKILPLLAALKDGLKTLAQLVQELAPQEISEDQIKVFLNALVKAWMIDIYYDGEATWETVSYALAPHGLVILDRSQVENK